LSAELHDARWNGVITTPHGTLDLDRVHAVWYRSPEAYQMPPELSPTEAQHARIEAKYGLGGVLASLPALWCNHPSRVADAAYKPVQLARAAEVGLAVPDTLITNEATAVRKFAMNGATVTKLVGGTPTRHRSAPDRAACRPALRSHTMTSTDTEWAGYAAGLVAALTNSGDLHDPAWVAAIAAIPRHLLVPTTYQQQPDGSWDQIDTHGPGLGLVYSLTTLVTETDADGRAVSSTTKPDLMVRMLEILDVHNGHRVLEIGTGTGYNAALLCHRLGASNVFSLDIDAGLIAAATQRLAILGYHPHLTAHDGIDDWPQYAPYHRIIATCSAPRIPWTWGQQLTADGKLRADVKFGTGTGNLALLHRHHDRLEGHFTTRWAAFMGMYHAGSTTPVRQPKAQTSHQRTTTTPAQPWNTHREVWLMACLALPTHLRYGYTLDPTTRTPTAATVSAPDGSWCEIDLATADNGSRRIREGGSTSLWAQVEHAYQRWQEWNQPSWERFGLTITTDTQAVWLDDPHNVLQRSDHPARVQTNCGSRSGA
jgi:protein-L-isoaspartate O-methyltransferase